MCFKDKNEKIEILNFFYNICEIGVSRFLQVW